MTEVHEPRWLRIAAFGSVLAIAAFGAVGLLLADLGFYKPALVLVLGSAAFVGLLRVARPMLEPGRAPSAPSKAGARIAAGISLAYAYWNSVNASEHVQINRDAGGGVYLNAAKWLARHGTLQVRPYVGPFSAKSSAIATSIGMNRHGSHLDFGVSHLLSALLAEAQNLGGDHLMFLTVPILSGLSLLLFYLLAHKLLRHPFAALGATMTLAFLMPQLSFSRDSTTEIPLQVLLFAAVWMLCDRRTLRDRGTAICAGLFVGLMQAMHPDGILFMIGLPVVYAVWWLRAKVSERHQLADGMRWSAIAAGFGVLLGLFDLLRTAHHLLTVVGGDIERLFVIVALVTAAVFLTMRTRSHRADLVQRVQAARARAGDVTGVLILIGGLGAWLIRPFVQKTHGRPNGFLAHVQSINHLALNPTRRYSELSVRWVGWYLGPLTLIIGIVAAAALARAIVRGSVRPRIQVPALFLGPPALLYLWRPTVTPDQVWAARRLLPAVLPGAILLTFGVLFVLARDRNRSYAAERRFGAILLALATVAFPLYTIHNVTQMTEQRGLAAEITSTCEMIGPKGAVLMLAEKTSTAYLSVPQTLRSFCNVPVAVLLRGTRPVALRDLATQWAAEGRQLFVVAQNSRTIQQALPGAVLMYTPVGENQHLLESTLTHRPRGYSSELFQLTAAAVPARK